MTVGVLLTRGSWDEGILPSLEQEVTNWATFHSYKAFNRADKEFHFRKLLM